jgi:long-subunit acyl-CoA synthetase (AMP-forming)
MIGVMTNFKEWIFTKYSLKKEIMKDINQSKETLNPFEMSKTFTILDDNFDIIPDQLTNVVIILEWLAIHFNIKK